MELLYSMFVTWDGALHIQKSSICIGFKVAAVLSDIFLSAIDCTIERKVQGVVKTIFRYIADFLIIFSSNPCTSHLSGMMKIFKENAFGLSFKRELPKA